MCPPKNNACKNTTANALLIIMASVPFWFLTLRRHQWHQLPPFRRHTLSDAFCLDGSSAVYYERIISHHDVAPTNSSAFVVVHLQGGGWCETDAECAARARTGFGSSKHNAAISEFPDMFVFGLFDMLSRRIRDSRRYGTSFQYILPYCDGGSWSGDHPDVTSRYRGRVTLEKTFRSIVHRTSASDVSDVLLTGCSAGGLGVVHACLQLQAAYPSMRIRCMHDGSLFFGSKRSMFETHHANVSYFDAIDVLRNAPNDTFFTLTDRWDWDFSTSKACKYLGQSMEFMCTEEERLVADARESVLRELARTQRVFVTYASRHCQLGHSLSPDLEAQILDFALSDRA